MVSGIGTTNVKKTTWVRVRLRPLGGSVVSVGGGDGSFDGPPSGM